MLPFFLSIVNFGEPTLSLGLPTMDMNIGMSLNPHVNDIENDNIYDINIFLCIECNILDNVPDTISMRQMRTHANSIYD